MEERTVGWSRPIGEAHRDTDNRDRPSLCDERVRLETMTIVGGSGLDSNLAASLH